MKIMKVSVLMIAFLIMISSFQAKAEEEPKPTASADLAVLTKYIWRGYELSDDSIVVQPSVTVEYMGFSMNLWGNLDTALDDGNPATDDDSDFNETDFTFSYDRGFGPVGVGIGFIYYALTGADTEEIYLSVGLDVPLSPSVTIYKDIAEFNGWYINLGISHSFALPMDISLDLAAGAGYYYSTDDEFVEIDDNLNATTNKYQNLHDGLLSAGLTVPLGKYITLASSIAYSFPLSGKADNLLRSTSFSNDSDFLYGGVTLSVSF